MLTNFSVIFWEGEHNSHKSKITFFCRGRRPKMKIGHFKNVQNRFLNVKPKFTFFFIYFLIYKKNRAPPLNSQRRFYL